MAKYGFHHVHLKTQDPEGTARFLIDNFGAEELSRSDSPGPFLRIRLQIGGQLVLINGSVPSEGYEGDSSKLHYGLDHYGLSVDDLDAAYQELTAKGVKFSDPPRAFGTGKIAFVLTPDNVRVELVEVK
jgi:catechol 2,3-dioxygenase-like lactoylglutathione lyase family enzyme